MRTVLEPIQVAKKCTLAEALHWVAFNVYPLSYSTENKKDIREDLEYQEEFSMREGDEMDIMLFFTKQMCQKYNFPTNYEEEYFEKHDERPCFSPFTLEQIKKYEADGQFPAEEIEKLIQKRQEQDAFDLKQKAFEDALEDYLEVPKSELFLALKKGLIKSHGRFIANISENGDSWPKHERIKNESWKSNSVVWNDSTLNVGKDGYIHVLVDTESLFAAFPEPEPEIVKIKKIGETLVIDNISSLPFTSTKIGRPSYNWSEFTQEMAKRMLNDQLPSLQKACVQDMKEWCIYNWGSAPSETNLKEHISPFYNAIKKTETK